VDVRAVILKRARRFFGDRVRAEGGAVLADSRDHQTYGEFTTSQFRWIITSPPYYGMRTYVPDQWLRNWFVGGPSVVDYDATTQLSHAGASAFASDLRSVWENVAAKSHPAARLVIRFGGINDREADPRDILKESLRDSGWTLTTMNSAGSADLGRRQAGHFGGQSGKAKTEFDAWARRATPARPRQLDGDASSIE
jgi:hypothetical protein